MAQRTVNHAVLTLALLTSVAAQMGVMMPSMGYMGFGGSMFGPGMSGGNQAGTTYKGGVNTENPNAVFSPPGKKFIKRVDVSAFLWLLLLLSFVYSLLLHLQWRSKHRESYRTVLASW